MVLQWLLVRLWGDNLGLNVGGAIVLPLLTALVYAFVATDAVEPKPGALPPWERFLERAWAVIVVDFVVGMVTLSGLSTAASQNPLAGVFGIAAFALSALLVFADVSATVDDDVTVWSVVPAAFLRSVAAAWNVRIFARALAIVSIELLLVVAQYAMLYGLQHAGVHAAAFWAQVPLSTLATPPLAAITLVIYHDAVVRFR
jgi:hypothetical protein